MTANQIAEVRQLQLKANAIRAHVVRSVSKAKSGHQGGPLGFADIFTALYFNVARHDPKNPDWDGRDRIILSHGHIAPVRYAAMAEAGYFPVSELDTLRQIGSRLQGHPHNEVLPGVETSSGPLGQGLSMAVGMALAARMDGKPHYVYALVSDGEHNEGQTWEAVLLASKFKLDHLIAVLDRNRIQIDGNTEDILPLESMAEKYRAFNWNVLEIDGHDFPQILEAFAKAKKHSGSPTMIIANTIPGKGVSFMENNFQWHGKPPNAQETEKALAELAAERARIEAGKG